MMRVRYTDEWVGALVIAAIAVLAVAILQAGVLRDWFKSTSELRLILPESGLAGLDVGDSVHISNVKLPKGAKSAIDDRDFTIATLVAPSALKSVEGDNETEAAEAPAEAAEGEAAAEEAPAAEGDAE